MFYDTDVLIWFFRGNAGAARVIDQDADRAISVVGYMELLQGAADKREARLIKEFLRECGIKVLPLTENIGHRASIYMEEFGLSSGMRVADALIAATAAENNLRLCTGDRRHFRAVRELEISVFRP